MLMQPHVSLIPSMMPSPIMVKHAHVLSFAVAAKDQLLKIGLLGCPIRTEDSSVPAADIGLKFSSEISCRTSHLDYQRHVQNPFAGIKAVLQQNTLPRSYASYEWPTS